MAEFTRISDQNRVDVLERCPMEPGLIPDCGNFLQNEFDRRYGLLKPVDGDTSLEGPTSNIKEVAAELYERYRHAIELYGLRSNQQPRRKPLVLPTGSMSLDEAAEMAVPRKVRSPACGKNNEHLHRPLEMMRQQIVERFPGLQFFLAAEQLWGRQSETRNKRVEYLELMLRFGYLPPVSARVLLEKGAGNTVGALPFAKQATEVIPGNPDAIKNLVLRPWPKGFFDKWFRVHLYTQASDEAFRRAYNDFMIWSQVDRDQLLSIDARERIISVDNAARRSRDLIELEAARDPATIAEDRGAYLEKQRRVWTVAA